MSHSIKTRIGLTWVFMMFGVSVGTAAPLLYEQPLSKKYHRLEVVVPAGFQAKCNTRSKSAECKLSIYSPELLRVFQIGSRKGVTIEANNRRKEIRFLFDDPRLVFQQKVLEGPPRWVIEVGYQEVLIQPVEDELPFRPYPMPVQTVKLPRPSLALSPLAGADDEVVIFNQCWALWEAKKYVDAYNECSKIDMGPGKNNVTARSAVRLIAEIVYEYLQQDSSANQEARKYVNTTVLIQGNRIDLKENTPVTLGFSVQGESDVAVISIQNSSGEKKYLAQIEINESGKVQKWEWPGTDSSGSELPAGIYSFTVEAVATEGQATPPETRTYIEGHVDGVRFDQGPEFLIGNSRVRIGEVVLPGRDTLGGDEDQKYFFVDQGGDPRDVAIKYLQKAEAMTIGDREKARYVLLASEMMSKRSINRATEYLKTTQSKYRKTDAEPFILAERVRLLLESNAHDEAKRVLDEIAQLDSQQNYEEYVMGSRTLALASLAYARGDFTNATALYDEARINFPELLTAEPGPLFQVAELYFRAKRLEEALPFYQEFLDRFSDQVPHWIARIRLAQIKSFQRPLEAFNEMQTLGETLTELEGKQLAKLYSITLSSNDVRGPDPDKVLKEVGKQAPTDYVLEELLMQKARNALRDGNLQKAFNYSQEIVEKMPESALLRDSSLFFQRLLLLEVDRLLRNGEDVELVLLYFKEKARRFRQPARRGLLHLYVARAMRDLKMLDEAAINVIAKGGLPGARDPKISALLNLELTGIYREKVQDKDLNKEAAREDINKFKQVVESLNKRFPNQFDNYDYWASRGYYYELQGEYRQAKKIYLYALNGPNMSPEERIKLARSIYHVYMKMPDYDKALHSLKILLQIYDEFKDQLDMPGFRVNILWNRVELHLQKEAWPEVVKSIKEYLEESQGMLSSLSANIPKTRKSKNKRNEIFFQGDLELIRRKEALFYHGYALLKLGLIRQAKREWDLLYKEDPRHVYGQLAEQELRMLSWRDVVSPELMKTIAAKP